MANSMADRALELAARGFRVFPLKPRQRIPQIENWQEEATTDPAILKNWWMKFPAANPGIATGEDVIVIDIDDKDNKLGSQSLQGLEILNDTLPDTLRVATPSGGTHIYLRPSKPLGLSAGKLGSGIDVRAVGGLVAAPGAKRANGEYTIQTDSDIAPAPAWLEELIGQPKPKADQAPLTEQDSSPAVKWAAHYLRHDAVEAVQGDAGDQTTFKVAATLKARGISEPMALELMLEHYNDRCSPPWTAEELEAKVANGFNYGKSQPGEQSPEHEFEPVAEAQQEGESILPDTVPLRRIERFNFADDNEEEEPDPLIESVLDSSGVGIAYGESSIGKTFVVMSMAYAIAAGKSWGGKKVKQGGVLYVATEGFGGMRKRVRALKKQFGGGDIPFRVMLASINIHKNKADAELIAREAKQMEEDFGVPVRLVVIDTMSAAMAGADENSAQEASIVLQRMNQIARAANCSVLGVHHTGKNKDGGARGSYVFKANADFMLEIRQGEIVAEKKRDDEKIQPIGFNLKVVELGHTASGRRVSSCVAEILTGAQMAFGDMPLTKEAEKALRALENIQQADASDPEGDDAPEHVWRAQEVDWAGWLDGYHVVANPTVPRPAGGWRKTGLETALRRLRDELINCGRVQRKGRNQYVTTRRGNGE